MILQLVIDANLQDKTETELANQLSTDYAILTQFFLTYNEKQVAPEQLKHIIQVMLNTLAYQHMFGLYRSPKCILQEYIDEANTAPGIHEQVKEWIVTTCTKLLETAPEKFY